MAPTRRLKTAINNLELQASQEAVSKDGSSNAAVRFSSSPSKRTIFIQGIILILLVFSICTGLFLVRYGMFYTLCLAAAVVVAMSYLLGLFVVTRHVYLTQKRKRPQSDLQAAMMNGQQNPSPDLSELPAVSYLYVLGSGGHTTEMMALIKLSFKANKNQHRRYITTSGDQHSLNQQIALEQAIQSKYPGDSAGTHDTVIVTRARSVYQSYVSSIFTSLQSAHDILSALTKVPQQRATDPKAKYFSNPHVIVTNGPGTGFVVGVVAHMLKIFFIVPDGQLRIVFVETWARTHKLGLTGKLFHMSNIANLFVVQSSTLSQATGKPTIGNVNLRYAQVGRRAVKAEQMP